MRCYFLRLIRRLNTILERINSMALTIQQQHDQVMAELAGLKTSFDASGQRVNDKVTALEKTIADLKAQLAQPGATADFSDVDAGIAALKTEAEAILPATPPPPPPTT
jgi:ABC-type transporter Mla subunit MlaD